MAETQPYNLQTTQQGIADTLTAIGSAAAPGAGAVIASIAAPGAGVYMVNVQALIYGTAVLADIGNMQLRHGTTVTGIVLSAIGGAGVASTGDMNPTFFARVTILAAETINVNCVGAANAGTVYVASINATRIA